MIFDDFIFGRSGRGLLTGRGFSFGGAILEKIYAAILATNPTVFVPLEYAVNPDDGTQILFQDSGATVPVTEIGQPIGAVVWDEVIVALQTTDARRPTWGGVGVGAKFNGLGDFLAAAAGAKWVPEFDEFYLMIAAEIVSFDSSDNVFSQFESSTAGRAQMQLGTAPERLIIRTDGPTEAAESEFPTSAIDKWILALGREHSDETIFTEIRSSTTGDIVDAASTGYANSISIAQVTSHIGGLLPNDIRFPEMDLRLLVVGADLSDRQTVAEALAWKS